MWWKALLAVLALSVAAEPFIAKHPHFAVEGIFGIHALYGFLACAVLILVAKAIGLALKRTDRYYDD